MLLWDDDDDVYWISQKLGPMAVMWNTNSLSCLKTIMSPILRSCATAKSSHPSVSFEPSIFTVQVLSDASVVSLAILTWSFLPWRCFKKKGIGMVCMHHTCNNKDLSEVEHCCILETKESSSTRWEWKPGRRGWKKCGLTGEWRDWSSIIERELREYLNKSLKKWKK